MKLRFALQKMCQNLVDFAWQVFDLAIVGGIYLLFAVVLTIYIGGTVFILGTMLLCGLTGGTGRFREPALVMEHTRPADTSPVRLVVAEQDVYQVTVDHNQSLEEQIAAGEYDDYGINEVTDYIHFFPDQEKGRANVTVVLCQPDSSFMAHPDPHSWGYSVDGTAVELGMKQMGLRPATFSELLAFGATRPDLQRLNLIVALGSRKFDQKLKGVLVPCLNVSSLNRSLCMDLPDRGWPQFAFSKDRRLYFAAVQGK